MPADAAEFLTLQPEPVQQRRIGGAAIDAVRAAGWWNYDGNHIPEAAKMVME